MAFQIRCGLCANNCARPTRAWPPSRHLRRIKTISAVSPSANTPSKCSWKLNVHSQLAQLLKEFAIIGDRYSGRAWPMRWPLKKHLAAKKRTKRKEKKVETSTVSVTTVSTHFFSFCAFCGHSLPVLG